MRLRVNSIQSAPGPANAYHAPGAAVAATLLGIGARNGSGRVGVDKAARR